MKHETFEKNSLILLIGILIMVSIGGLVQIVPLFYLQNTIEKVEGISEPVKDGATRGLGYETISSVTGVDQLAEVGRAARGLVADSAVPVPAEDLAGHDRAALAAPGEDPAAKAALAVAVTVSPARQRPSSVSSSPRTSKPSCSTRFSAPRVHGSR